MAAPQLYTPAYLQWAYDLTYLSASDGSGDTVAVVDAYDDPTAEADLAQFRQEYGLWPCAATADALTCQQAMDTAGNRGSPIFQQYNQTGQLIDQSGNGIAPPTDTTYPGSWEVEESLDVDAISSVCPHCTIDLVEAGSDSNSDLQQAVDEAGALTPDQISMSWGEDANEGCDSGTWWFTGVSSLASAGDYGYQGASSTAHRCHDDNTDNTVSYPAADSQVTAVGGTSLAQADTPRGFTESVWNDGYVQDQGSYEATQSGCDTSQPVPSYQAGVTTDCSGRAYNDISADADPYSGLAVYDSFGGTDGCDTTPSDPGSCVVGGTSLATPLTAAYEALAGVTPADSPAWAYADSSNLNDITSGNDNTNDTCLSVQVVICEAETGWDGPTGNGSISGDLVNGAPGIGGSYVTATTPGAVDSVTATLTAGVYPNGEPTTYQVDYGTTTSYGITAVGTASLSGSALTAASDTVSGLTPCTEYHFRFDATNETGTFSGYDSTFLALAPSIAGTADPGDVLTGSLNLPAETSCPVTYQWLESDTSTGTFTAISGATTSTYTPSSSDQGEYLELAVTDTATQQTATSQPFGPIAAPPAPGGSTSSQATARTTSSPSATTATTTSSGSASTSPPQPTVIAAPTTTSSGGVGAAITVSGGVYANASGMLIQFFRCAHTCVLLSTHGATNYVTKTADLGHYIKVKLTVHGATGTTPVSLTNWVGPITDAGAGALSITSGARIASVLKVQGSTGVALATVRITRRTGQSVKLAISRTTSTPTSAWVCVISDGAPVSCTVAHTINGALNLSVAVKQGESLKLIAVRSQASAHA